MELGRQKYLTNSLCNLVELQEKENASWDFRQTPVILVNLLSQQKRDAGASHFQTIKLFESDT